MHFFNFLRLKISHDPSIAAFSCLLYFISRKFIVLVQCCSDREHNTFGSGNILILSPVQKYLTQDCDILAYSFQNFNY